MILRNIYRWVADDFFLTLAFLLAIYMPLSSIAPAMEGKLFPVTKDTIIETVSTTANGNSLVKLTFTNVRDCRYLNLVWTKVGEDGVQESVFVNFLKDNDVKSRGLGKHKTQTWYVEMPSELLRDYSVVKVRHSCHFLWNTVTQIYP